MDRRLRLLVLVMCALAVLAPSLPAAGHHSEDDHSRNMRNLAFIPRSSAATQSDFAFRGNFALSANYNGFRIIDISRPDRPRVVRDVWCPGPQNDISLWGDAIVLSADTVREANPARAGATAYDCDSITADPQNDPAGWEGLRVFSLREILDLPVDADGFVRPVGPAAAVYTDCGSHTHTGIPHGDHVDIYVASYPLRSGPGCGPDNPEGEDPLHKKISIVQVDPRDAANASLLKEVPIDVPTWDLLSGPGFNPMQGCHDFMVDMSQLLVAAACSSVGQLWDVSDPHNPGTLNFLWEVDEPEVQFYHSGMFSEDETTVVFGDEIISGSCDDGTGSGQIWFHDATDGSLQSSFQIPRPQPGEYCSSHMFNNITTLRRDVLISAWYGGGVTVVDYTDRANPVEIGYYDVPGNSIWSAYWYDGFIYGSDIPNGFRTYGLRDPAKAGAHKLGELNPQTQE